ncbi:hypothetical protein GYMLUDRAFT_407494 [Collybiopsis luxurians FD-317 M1]|uniref:Uncharacterized protein n=1 Tax=Collybiopsis luxurians FD-317 M1 TaxID=944289 RepID=A0A0D0B9Y5_9AGAR|nr:hypothetical protein GYMLUDRAFT_407494 [Collybiopsis luxurians FD-317 M1]
MALATSNQLRQNGYCSWLMDIDWLIRNLPNSTQLCDITPAVLHGLFKCVRSLALQNLQSNIQHFYRLRLLKDRRELAEDGSFSYKITAVRHYLTNVKNGRHHLTPTRLLCGALSPPTFRASPGKPLFDDGPSSRSYSYRLCGAPFETVEHALFQCMGQHLLHTFVSTLHVDGGFCAGTKTSANLLE